MEDRPLVSILMTAFNRERYISKAIESVLVSGYIEWELIITDDCSTDGTLAIAQAYAAKNNRIKVYRNEANLGDYPNRNKAASYAGGKYIVIVDSDDMLFPDALEKWVIAMQELKAEFGIFSFGADSVIKQYSGVEIINYHFFSKPLLNFGPIATIVTTNYFKRINGFPTKYGVANDMYYNLKAASGTNTVVFPFPLVNYRRHDGQEINNKYSYLYNSYLYLRDALSELNLPLSLKQKNYLQNKNRRRFLTNVFKFFLKTKDFKKAKEAVVYAQFNMTEAFKAVFH